MKRKKGEEFCGKDANERYRKVTPQIHVRKYVHVQKPDKHVHAYGVAQKMAAECRTLFLQYIIM